MQYTIKSIINFVESVRNKFGEQFDEPEKFIHFIGGCILNDGTKDKIIISNNIVFLLAEPLSGEYLRIKLATMIGHLFLHMSRNNDNEIYECNDMTRWRTCIDESRNAETFAMQMLMPNEVFEDELRRNTHNGRIDMNIVSQKFGVPLRFALDWGKCLELLQWF